MLKRAGVFLFIIVLLLAFSACGGKRDGADTGAVTTDTAPSDTEETANVTAEAAGTEDTPDTEVISDEEFDVSLCRPIIIDGKYVFNPFLLSCEAIDVYGEDFARFYYGFIKAYADYGTSCPCPSEEYAMMLDMVLQNECPFYAGNDIDYSWATNYDYEKNMIFWTFNVDRDTFDSRVRKVTEVMQGLMDLVGASDHEKKKTETLYHAFCPLMTYDHERAESREKIDGCYVFTENRGICVSFAWAFSELMSQVGMYATTASGETTDGEAHSWNYIRVDGNFYFFDPTFELNYKNGTAYVYYGMTLEERAREIKRETITAGHYSFEPPVTPEIHLNVG